MDNLGLKSNFEKKEKPAARKKFAKFSAKPILFLYRRLAPRAYSVIMFASLFCTLAVKFFHSLRHNCVNEYFSWILADVTVLLGIETVLTVVCFCRPRRWIIRTCCVFAAVICTWSVMNAGWLIRTGTQILPTVLLPLIRDPINALGIIGVNLAKMPAVAVILLAPSALVLAFLFSVMTKPLLPDYNRRRLKYKTISSLVIVVTAALAHAAVIWRGSVPFTSVGMRYNAQLRAALSLLTPASDGSNKADFKPSGKIPTSDKIEIALLKRKPKINHDVVIVVLEGIQYNHTSLADRQDSASAGPTPYLASIARNGAVSSNARSTLTHTTKVLFSLLTGRYPSVSQGLAETVPVDSQYASLATILKSRLNFRTAFFQSAKGNFEARAGLVHNLGFEKFWARDDLNDINTHLGYLASDEFAMLKPIVHWIKADRSRPFLLVTLCSVTHDPYEVPQWFAAPAKKPVERYRQSIAYTDNFIAALDIELAKLGLVEKTILCVVGDHGEAFGEHGLFGHERIAFDEALRIPLCIRASSLVKPKTIITQPVASIDLTPTILGLLGFDITRTGFDGLNALGPIDPDRQLFFSGWLGQSPAGFVQADRKYVHDPVSSSVTEYNLYSDPLELAGKVITGPQAGRIAKQISAWRNKSIFCLEQKQTGERTLFGPWLCDWTGRVCSARYIPDPCD